MSRLLPCALGLLASSAACTDPLDQRLALVDEPRLLAIVSEPAEVVPGEVASYQAVIGGPGGPDDRAPAWALCLAPKPPTEDNSVAVGCLGEEVTAIGEGTSVAGTVPADACLRFGPDTTMPGFRPRDPDSTGGYYQPVRAELPGEDADLVGFGFTRIKCRLPTAPTGVSQEHFTRYVPNVNPVLLSLEIDGEARTRVAAGSRVTITASWPRDAAETFLYYDPSTQRLIERREAMRVAWFTTAGSLDVDASAVTEDEPESAASTTWTTPDAGTAWLWLVLRDSRGGIATSAVELLVE